VKTTPDHAFVPRGRFTGKNYGRNFVGMKFGAASKVRRLDSDERRAIEERLRQEGAL
jgi:hypothetical protein